MALLIDIENEEGQINNYWKITFIDYIYRTDLKVATNKTRVKISGFKSKTARENGKLSRDSIEYIIDDLVRTVGNMYDYIILQPEFIGAVSDPGE